MATRTSFYQQMIMRVLYMMKRGDVNPAHVEAYMRLQYGTLDHLDAGTFAKEVRIGVECVDEAGIDRADELAESYGLVTRRASNG